MSKRIIKKDWFGGKRSTSRRHKGKLYNQIRTVKENGIMYFEVKLQEDYTMLCDVKDYKLLRSRIWSAWNNNNIYYCRGYKNNKHKLFHRLLHTEWKCINHINRDGFDNRCFNLRDGSEGVNHKNKKLNTRNTSGYNGLSYCQKDKI